MRTLTANYRSNDRLVVAGVLACLLAVASGMAAATDYGVLFAGVIVGSIFFSIAIIVYIRDPVLAVIWLWVFEVF